MASIARRPSGRWMARIRVDGREYTRTFDRKLDAQRWSDAEKAKLQMGTWTDPDEAQSTVADWCETWLHGYGSRRVNTVKAAQVHIHRITAEFGRYRLAAVRPSDVQAWTRKLKAEGLEPSYVHALYRRLAQIMEAAVADGIIAKSPCSRRTSPPRGKQRSYVATTRQVRNVHDAFPPHLRSTAPMTMADAEARLITVHGYERNAARALLRKLRDNDSISTAPASHDEATFSLDYGRRRFTFLEDE